jgi:O-acetylhomoserine (thiol)-lyase
MTTCNPELPEGEKTMSEHKISTLALHAGQEADAATKSRAVPICQTTSYVFDSTEHAANLFGLKEFGNIYTRLMNPTTDVWEKRMAALEGGTGALATASGMSAVFIAISNIVQAGDHIIASSSLYGGTDTFFRYSMPRFGVEVTFIKELTPEKVKEEIKDNTKLVYAETIGNPNGEVLDLEGVAQAAHAQGVPFFIDNTFAPLLCKVFDYGVDICIHSCTKWIGGHGTSIGGVVIDSGNFDWSSGRFPEFTTPDESYNNLLFWEAFGNHPQLGNVAFILKARLQGMRNFGPCPSPFNSFLILQGIETLPLRMKAHCDNTMELAKWLKQHPQVAWVNYVGLPDHTHHAMANKYLKGGYGAVFGFGIKGGSAAAEKFINSVKLASHLANVGDAKTLVIHPASTTHSQSSEETLRACGISPDFIRVAVGIEDISDIKVDFEQALAAAL